MNDIQASHRPVYGGYIGIIRRVHKADVRAGPWQARRAADLRHLGEAELAAHRALLRHVAR